MAFLIKSISGRQTLDEGEYVLGRDPNVEIYLDAPKVSRRHARITIAAARATIEDLGSKNGTFVGDQRVDGSITALRVPSSTETEGTASTRLRILPDA